MGIATSYYQVLRAQCYPPRSIHPTVSTTDHHRYSAPIRGKLCRIRPSPDAKLGRTPPFSLFDSSDPNARFTQSYSTNFPTFLPTNITHSLHSTYLFYSDYLSPPAMHYLILRSHYTQVFSNVVVASIAVAESQNVSPAPSPVPTSSTNDRLNEYWELLWAL